MINNNFGFDLKQKQNLISKRKYYRKKIELAWSYILDFENAMNPFEQRKIVIHRWKKHASIDTDETIEIIERSKGSRKNNFTF